MIQILIADDSETFRNTLVTDLSQQGYTIHEASDGLEALAKLRALAEIKLLILDVNMPGANGLEVLEVGHSEKLLDGKLIFMLTTDADKELKERAKRLGVKAWITKPYKKEVLLMAIAKVLGK